MVFHIFCKKKKKQTFKLKFDRKFFQKKTWFLKNHFIQFQLQSWHIFLASSIKQLSSLKQKRKSALCEKFCLYDFVIIFPMISVVFPLSSFEQTNIFFFFLWCFFYFFLYKVAFSCWFLSTWFLFPPPSRVAASHASCSSIGNCCSIFVLLPATSVLFF